MTFWAPTGRGIGVAAGTTNADLDNAATLNTVIQGAFGKLTLAADGSYSYTRDPGTSGGVNDVFTYTIKDGDGDLSHTTLTISVGDSTPTDTIPAPGGATTTVFEHGLPARGAEPRARARLRTAIRPTTATRRRRCRGRSRSPRWTGCR